jgi:hypothetical protein
LQFSIDGGESWHSVAVGSCASCFTKAMLSRIAFLPSQDDEALVSEVLAPQKQLVLKARSITAEPLIGSLARQGAHYVFLIK